MENEGYHFKSAKSSKAHAYLMPALKGELRKFKSTLATPHQRLFDLGSGNGSVAANLTNEGWDVTGVDPSASGIAAAHETYPDMKLYEGSAYDELAVEYG